MSLVLAIGQWPTELLLEGAPAGTGLFKMRYLLKSGFWSDLH